MIGHLLGRFALLPAEPGNGLRPKAAVNYQDNQPEGFVGSGTHHLRENVEDNYIYIYRTCRYEKWSSNETHEPISLGNKKDPSE